MAIKNRDVGDMGEAQFQSMCSSAGLIANKANRDLFGWDYAVQAYFESQAGLPSDMEPLPLDCKVQVKSTDDTFGKCQVEVSNLKKMSLSVTPSFYCFLEFNSNDFPDSVYVVHVDEQLIGRVLKRIRVLEEKGKGGRLNKHKMTITYDQRHKIAAPTGKALKAALVDYVPNGMAAYTEEKNFWLKSLGFESGGFDISFTVSGENAIGDLHDFFLGLSNVLHVASLKVRRKRFGIVSKRVSHEAKFSQITREECVVGTPSTLSFKKKVGAASVEFEAELLASQANSLVPSGEGRYLIKSSFFNLLIDLGKKSQQFTLNVSPRDTPSLKALGKLFRVVDMFNGGEDGSPLLTIKPQDLECVSLGIQTQENLSSFAGVSGLCRQAIEIANYCEIDLETIVVAAEELVVYQGNIIQLHSIIFGDAEKFGGTVRAPNRDGESYPKIIKDVTSIAISKTRLGNTSIVVFCALIGELSYLSDRDYQFMCISKRIGPVLTKKRGENTPDQVINIAGNAFKEQLKKEGYLIFPGD